MKHHRKLTTLTALLIICLSAKVFAIGCGVQAGVTPGLLMNEEDITLEHFTGKLTGTVRLSRLPVAFGGGFIAGKDNSDFSFGLFTYADYYAVDVQLKNTWSLYSGFGAEGSLLTPDFEKLTASAGARFFIGMDWLFYDNFIDFYCQQNVVPTYIRHFEDSASRSDFMLCFPFETGIRMHF